jgi:Protein of unknown function (DUF732)
MVKTALYAAVVAAIWLAPTASADAQDQQFLSYLAANKVAVDPSAAIRAAHIACAQIAQRQTSLVVASVVAEQVPAVTGNEFWIAAGAREAYCPDR